MLIKAFLRSRTNLNFFPFATVKGFVQYGGSVCSSIYPPSKNLRIASETNSGLSLLDLLLAKKQASEIDWKVRGSYNLRQLCFEQTVMPQATLSSNLNTS